MKKILIIIAILCAAQAARAYTPPKGIPDPGDYWTTTHPIDTANPNTVTYCPGWHEGTPRANSIANGDDRNCYYVDNATGCSDSSNTYGYPGNPRCTGPARNPSNVAHGAGTYIEIYGGDGRTGYTWFPSFGEGTGAQPIWVVGKNYPVISSDFDLSYYSSDQTTITYLIIDGLKLEKRLKLYPNANDITYSNICFRNGKINQSAINLGSGVSIGGTSWTLTGTAVSYIVIYNNDIGPIGVKTEPHQEFCAVFTGTFVHSFFILNNLIHDAVEDGVAGGHAAYRTSSNIYVGKNTFYGMMTNAIDIKHLTDIIVSENNIYSGVGADERYVLEEGIVGPHYAGDSPGSGTNERYKNYPKNFWFIFNKVYDADYGLVASVVENIYIVGNIFYDIKHMTMDPSTICIANEIPNKCCTGEGTGSGCPESWGEISPYSTGAAIHLRGIRGDAYVVNNTIYDSDGGIMIENVASDYSSIATYYRAYSVRYNGKDYYCINDDSGVGITNIAPDNATYWAETTFHVTDNIVSSRSESTFYDYSVASDIIAEFDRNLAYHSVAPYIYWISNTQRDMDYVYENTSFCGTTTNTCLESNPLFVNPSEADFSLQVTSPAIDKTETPSAVYAIFNALYGRSIQKDISGKSRPIGGSWDIGAYEYDPATVRSAVSIGAGAGVSIGSGATMTLY